MLNLKASKSLVEQLLDLDDPAPKNFDIEDIAEPASNKDDSSSDDDSVDEAAAREHYEEVGKSKLRTTNTIDLGPQYEGSSVSRNNLLAIEGGRDPFGSQSEHEDSGGSDYADPEGDLDPEGLDDNEEIDSEEAFESGDEEKFERFTFRGQMGLGGDLDEGLHKNGVQSSDAQSDHAEANLSDSSNSGAEDEDRTHEEDSDVDMDDIGNAASDDSDNTSISDEPLESTTDDRAALRKMMAEERKTVALSLSKAAKADIAKGQAIKRQRTTFDALLNGRIKLQKALIATNSMSASETISADHKEAINAAETAALTLWNNISSLRASLQNPKSKERPFSATNPTTSATLWSAMQSQDSHSLPLRRATLTKWSQKTNPAMALTRTNKFSQAPTQQPLTSVLDQHLSGSNMEKLIQKTRVPRSCAPIQATARATSDPNIYDDADLYTLLLRELVDQRMADSNAPVSNGSVDLTSSLPSQRDFKVKKVVDTKASKGRKMRYTVHEKLQNFMAPDDRGTWGERQRAELFGSLLGRKVQLAENEDGVGSDADIVDNEMEGVEGGLRLFE